MEQKIYPLNLEQGGENNPLRPKAPKQKKPTFKEWIESRKWMVLAVVGVCVFAIGAVFYLSGMGSKLLGNLDPGAFDSQAETDCDKANGTWKDYDDGWQTCIFDSNNVLGGNSSIILSPDLVSGKWEKGTSKNLKILNRNYSEKYDGTLCYKETIKNKDDEIKWTSGESSQCAIESSYTSSIAITGDFEIGTHYLKVDVHESTIGGTVVETITKQFEVVDTQMDELKIAEPIYSLEVVDNLKIADLIKIYTPDDPNEIKVADPIKIYTPDDPNKITVTIADNGTDSFTETAPLETTKSANGIDESAFDTLLNPIKLNFDNFTIPGGGLIGNVDFDSPSLKDISIKSYQLWVYATDKILLEGTTIGEYDKIKVFSWDGKIDGSYVTAGSYKLKLEVEKPGTAGPSQPGDLVHFTKDFTVISNIPKEETPLPTLTAFGFIDPLSKASINPEKLDLYAGKEMTIKFQIDNYDKNLDSPIYLIFKNATDKFFKRVLIGTSGSSTKTWTKAELINLGLIDGKEYKLTADLFPQAETTGFEKELVLNMVKTSVPVKEICTNGIDDDGDGLIDLKDINDCPSTPTPKQCDDKIDNDKDGYKDYPKDKGCTSANDDSENSDNKKTIDADDMEISDVSISKSKFNPDINEVQFVYTIDNDAEVVIEIYDSKGKLVTTIKEEDQEKGQHVVWWNGSMGNELFGESIPDGTYTYKITATNSKDKTSKDTKEGQVIVDSTTGTGAGDFEDLDGGGTKPASTNTAGTNTGTLASASNNAQANASVLALQNSTTGQTAGTGPGVLLYLLIPALALPLTKKHDGRK